VPKAYRAFGNLENCRDDMKHAINAAANVALDESSANFGHFLGLRPCATKVPAQDFAVILCKFHPQVSTGSSVTPCG
jgi:hypothetical protein